MKNRGKKFFFVFCEIGAEIQMQERQYRTLCPIEKVMNDLV